jgi:hypothetical protein
VKSFSCVLTQAYNFRFTPVRAVCSTKKIRPANWYGSKDRMSRRWGCSECSWVFKPSGRPAAGESLDERKRTFRTQLSEEFASHACAEPPRVKGATPWRRRVGRCKGRTIAVLESDRGLDQGGGKKKLESGPIKNLVPETRARPLSHHNCTNAKSFGDPSSPHNSLRVQVPSSGGNSPASRLVVLAKHPSTQCSHNHP